MYSNGDLTWHEGVIPEDEIKIGGDKGGSSFKMNFQICNVVTPNSKTNTCVFCAFLAYKTLSPACDKSVTWLFTTYKIVMCQLQPCYMVDTV